MKILNCPLNGPRNISEFAYLGEVKPLPAADRGPSRMVGFRVHGAKPAGPVREWWLHVATNYLFIVDRDTRTDEILATYRIGDARLARTAGGSAS